MPRYMSRYDMTTNWLSVNNGKKGRILSLDAVNLESALLTNAELLLHNLIHAEQVLRLRNKSVIVARTGLEFADS